MQTYAIGFEGVELVSGLREDQPVWLYMQARVFNESDLATPLWMGEIGSLPPDANRPVDPSFPVGNQGLFAPSLPTGQLVTNSTNWGWPTFKLPGAPVDDGQVLEVQVFMFPRAWMVTTTVPADEADQISIGIFTGLVGNFVGGPLGGIVSGVLAGIFSGGADSTVEVPCFNSVIAARHLFTKADLDALSSAGQQRFGPRDNTASAVCEPIDSYYWLSANNAGWSFGTSTPAAQGSCELVPFARSSYRDQLRGGWGDVGDRYTDHVLAFLSFPQDEGATISLREGQSGPFRQWSDIPVELAVPSPVFTRNVYAEPGPPTKLPAPFCPECSHFSNLKWVMYLPPKAFAALALAGTHRGALPPLTPTTHHLLSDGESAERARQDPCAEADHAGFVEAIRRLDGDTALIGDNLLIQQMDRETIALWPTGTKPPTVDRLDRKLFDHVSSVYAEAIELDVPVVMYGIMAWELRCPPDVVLYSYAELREGKPCLTRLRYVRFDEDGNVVTDALLGNLPAVIH